MTLSTIVLVTGCFDNDKLTNDKAQKALDTWTGNSGKIVVLGIQEVPQANAAQANINFDNFQWKSDRPYSGPGTALFSRFNDGRWMLQRVATSNGLGSVWWNDLNIEVK